MSETVRSSSISSSSSVPMVRLWNWFSNSLVFYLILTLAHFVRKGATLWKGLKWDDQWDDWWHYKEGAIGGPSQWGSKTHMLRPIQVWKECQRGRRQSPVNISTDNLVFDPTLRALKFNGAEKALKLDVENLGQDVQITVSSGESCITSGPFSYRYCIFGANVKFGADSRRGSDHRVDGVAFPGELQIYAYNSELYSNFTEALGSPNGLAAISALMKVGDMSTKDMYALVTAAERTRLKGQKSTLSGIQLSSLLPSVSHYMTYEGSLPFPPCHETVTWVLLNQPLLITETELKTLRRLRMSSVLTSASMADNFRPLQKLNNRSIRTNIDIRSPQSEVCSMRKEVYYTANLPKS